MPDSLDLSLLAGTATDFARDNREHIASKLLNPGMNGIPGTPIKPMMDYVTPIVSKDEVVLTEFIFGNMLQPDKRNGFTPLNDRVKLKPRRAKVKPAKINLRFTETQLVAMNKSYYGMIQGPQSKLILDRIPVFEAYINEKIVEKAQSELRNISMFMGVLNANNAAPAGIMNGLRTKWDADILSGEIPAGNIVTINAITTANAVTEIKKIMGKVPAAYRYTNRLICLISPEHMDAYEQHYQTSRGALPYNSSFEKKYIEGSMIEFFVEPGMSGYETPVITTKGNVCWLYDDDASTFSLTFDYNKRDEDLAYILKFQNEIDYALAEELWFGNVL
ncbi:MAG: hypothetical protein EAZ80_01665 [Runella slithyformis]|nr:MAG: hypothetical protein EAZ80_01665 [Runella slithyformis]TAF48664.1 MAG: hypothetical protein EAZ63_03690 [Runella slithyformis]